MTWSRDDYDQWTWVTSLWGAVLALTWLGTDAWFAGLFAIGCLVFAYWCWIRTDRHD